MTADRARIIFLDKVKDLRKMCQAGTPLVFVAACAMLDYLVKLTNGADKKGQGYKDFIRDYLAQVRPGYKTFKYKTGKTDLPEQMYHVLRCGIVHSYSLVPDARAIKDGGRERSIALCHKCEAQEKGWKHLDPYSTATVADAAIFIAEDFVDDIGECINIIFDKAATDKQHEQNILCWIKKHPPITGGF